MDQGQKETYRLFLDDIREPVQVGNYILPVELREEYRINEWTIVRSYKEFISTILTNGLPSHVSFDHDLADFHYQQDMQVNPDYNDPRFDDNNEKTGYHCVQWLIDYCNRDSVALPVCYIHSMNPDGAKNIKQAITDYYFKREKMEELEKYQRINSAESIKELEEAIKAIGGERGIIMGRKTQFKVAGQVQAVAKVVSGEIAPNYLTRSYGIRQQALYLAYHAEK